MDAHPTVNRRGVRRLGAPSTWGVRLRSTVAAVVVVLVAATLASAALLFVLHRSLDASLDAALFERTSQIAGELATTAPTDLDPTLLLTGGQTSVVQVVDGSGRVVASSAGAPEEPLRIFELGAGETTARFEDEGRVGHYRGVARAAGGFTVIAAADEGQVLETVGVVAALLAFGLPVIVAGVGVATYVLVGRSLQPVERMRATVSAISTADLSGRLTVPPTRDEVAALASTLNAMLGRLDAGHTAVRRFVSDASHELRSPLATLTAALEIGAEKPHLLDANLLAHQLLPEARRMQHLVEDLLLLAKADEQGLPLRLGDVDIDDILGAELARVRATTTLNVAATIEPTRVRGDAARLTRAVRNLVDNAVRHARTTVTLSCRPDGGLAVVEVTDDGPGVPEQERAHVLERFVRLDSGRARDTGGSGLGLAIVAEIVSAHTGVVHVSEGPAGGARIVMSLPHDGPAQSPVSTSR